MTIGTKEWSTSSVNFQSGCTDCSYCYARMMANDFGQIKWDDWCNPVIRQKNVQKSYGKRKGTIMFPTSHNLDLWNIHEGIKVLNKLADADNDVLVVLKPSCSVVERICRLVHNKSKIEFRFTITSTSQDKLSLFETGAPGLMDRFNAMHYALRNRVKTSISIEPFLDSDPSELIEDLLDDGYGVKPEDIWIGPMNHLSRLIKLSPIIAANQEYLRRIYRPKNLEFIKAIAIEEGWKINFKDGFLKQLKAKAPIRIR